MPRGLGWLPANPRVQSLKTCLRYLSQRPAWMWCHLPLFMCLVEMGYNDRISELIDFDISGRHVMDLGCGNGYYGPIYLLWGAAQYTGCDYKLSPDAPMTRDFRTWNLKNVHVRPSELSMKFRGRIRLYQGDWTRLKPDAQFDVVAMYLVTEHLVDIESAFAWAHRHLRQGGKLVYLHHNYYCWNGHHQIPRTVHEIDVSSEEQKKYMDWNHLRYRPEPDEYVASKLNRIRLDTLQSLTDAFFEIEKWDEKESDEHQGKGRLTSQLLSSFPQYTGRDLLTQSVRCVAAKTA
jgi:SAM-dependent methyltransferase